MKLIFLLLFILGTIVGHAQSGYEFSTSKKTIAGHSEKAFVLTLYRAHMDEVQKAWKKHFKSIHKTKPEVNDNTVIFRDVVSEKFSSDTLDFYALIENKELDIVLNLQIQNGNTWVDPDETEGLSNAVRKNLIVFATDVHEMVLIRELDEEESKLKEQNKELEEYRKEIEKSKKQIHSDSLDIISSQEEIEMLETGMADLKQQYVDQDVKVKTGGFASTDEEKVEKKRLKELRSAVDKQRKSIEKESTSIQANEADIRTMELKITENEARIEDVQKRIVEQEGTVQRAKMNLENHRTLAK
ncbi:MAG TPA: hypothetical protein DDX92_12395 [Flavobacteriales bacterium]|jgi:hypothetical protein|nr:hypothetical protein [Flavobacteriales bacterium]